MVNISRMTKKKTSREKLIQAAQDLLIEKAGLEFTVRAVAAKAGVNHGLIHHYFAGIEGLMLEVVERLTQEVYAKVREGLPATRDRALLFTHLVKQVSLNGNFARFLLAVARLSIQMPKVKEKMIAIASLRRQQFSQVLGLGPLEDMQLVQATLLGSLLLSQVDPEIKPENILQTLAGRMEQVELKLNHLEEGTGNEKKN